MPEERFGFQTEKLGMARSMLMAPHPGGEVESFTRALLECSLALQSFDKKTVDSGDALQFIGIIEKTIGKTNLDHPGIRETFRTKAEQLSEMQRLQFSLAVDRLATWFSREHYSAG